MNSSRPLALTLGTILGSLVSVAVVSAWTAPTGAPPTANVSAPINVGNVNQVKSSNLAVNGLAVFGDTLLQASSYLNWGATAGTTGYGVRDNAGVMEIKNSGGSWSPIGSSASTLGGSGTATYVPKFTAATTLGNSLITDTGSSVGIGIASAPNGTLDVETAVASKTGIYGQSSSGYGVYGLSTSYIGARGTSNSNIGVYGDSSSNIGVYGNSVSSIGVQGVSGGANYGVYGQSANNYGVYGKTQNASYGGVLGYAANGTIYGILGHANAYSFYGNSTVYTAGNMQAAGYFHNSDRRLKDNIQTIAGIDTIQKLRGVDFTWKQTGKQGAGLVAQEVETVMPYAVDTGIDGIKRVDYDQVIGPLVEAIKEQQVEINTLRYEIKKLQENK